MMFKFSLIIYLCGLISYASANEVQAIYNNGVVEVSWRNSIHSKVDYFVIERSKYGRYFKEVIRVEGNKNEKVNYVEYFEIDSQPYKRRGYYRVKRVDINGTTYYSNIAFAENIQHTKLLFHLFDKSTKLSVKGYHDKDLIVVLVDSLKKKYVARVSIIEENGSLVITQTDVSLPSGDYLITGASDITIYGKKVMVDGVLAIDD